MIGAQKGGSEGIGGRAVSSADLAVRLIAFYLPQFHPIPENDEWWGRGFTEWTNVVKARPLFRGHYQPHLPADLGFYDLRLPEAREAQAELAKQYGIHGFCYYHYWFGGRRLLERPFSEVLSSGRPDFPFCLCWANDSWSRTWDGISGQILVTQEYGEEDDRRHMQSLAQVFADERYIRVDGKPLFLVYRSSSMPDSKRTTEIWREEAHRLGIGELYLCRVESRFDLGDPVALGFDAAVEFQPHFLSLPPPQYSGRRWLLHRKLGMVPKGYRENCIVDYEEGVGRLIDRPHPGYLRHRGVAPSWDNSPRRAREAIILHNANPDVYERWLKIVIERTVAECLTNRMVFINAWNEWAEGCHLEPCQKWGRAYLESTRRALDSAVTEAAAVSTVTS